MIQNYSPFKIHYNIDGVENEKKTRSGSGRNDGSGLHLACEFECRGQHLPAGIGLQVGVAGQTRLVAAAVLAQGFLGRDIADAAIGQLDRET